MKRLFLIVLMVCMLCTTVFAHSGRTDANGGHRDNKNVSGLGYYHYHCGGHPAHLHTGGVCPYSYAYSSNDSYGYSSQTHSHVENIIVHDFKQSLVIGETIEGRVSLVPELPDIPVYWSSSDSSVIRINGSIATAVGIGTCVIRFSAENVWGDYSVTVTSGLPESVEIRNLPINNTIAVGQGWQFFTMVLPWNSTDKTVRFGTSGDWRIGTISEDGFFTATATGVTTVYVYTSNGKYDEVKITVVEA